LHYENATERSAESDLGIVKSKIIKGAIAQDEVIKLFWINELRYEKQIKKSGEFKFIVFVL